MVDREKVREVRKDIFGLQLPSLDIFNLGGGGKAAEAVAKGDDVDKISAVVKQASREASRWVIELDTGAVWRQIDDQDLANDPHAGSKAEIRKGAIGSFFMKLDGQPGIRVHRDR